MRKVAVAMFFVVMAMSASWSPATARPYAEQPSAGGSANTALPPPTHWRGYKLLPLEQKQWRPPCHYTNDPNK
ncbi:Os02g0737600 [Oryza sativa Japonica Group]|uniref:Os02g0737600 protein n=1 Tax=Oryza sativa subsp. japonica TaxID=39947 RepID=C7IZ00_ORYSJ|nr:hypothetical protein DAI22_02g326400 [Oryza sativa Japonica Group]BAH91874.1 Os02g0737600 [Oryza sativa Japonica Group]|eukprot:NP_001173145.1 Os02g0737600 [Oryza sativa Japonica Group]